MIGKLLKLLWKLKKNLNAQLLFCSLVGLQIKIFADCKQIQNKVYSPTKYEHCTLFLYILSIIFFISFW